MSLLHVLCRDFDIKIVNTDTTQTNQKILQGHEAPILGLSVHPKETYLVRCKLCFTISLHQKLVLFKKKKTLGNTLAYHPDRVIDGLRVVKLLCNKHWKECL